MKLIVLTNTSEVLVASSYQEEEECKNLQVTLTKSGATKK